MNICDDSPTVERRNFYSSLAVTSEKDVLRRLLALGHSSKAQKCLVGSHFVRVDVTRVVYDDFDTITVSRKDAKSLPSRLQTLLYIQSFDCIFLFLFSLCIYGPSSSVLHRVRLCHLQYSMAVATSKRYFLIWDRGSSIGVRTQG